LLLYNLFINCYLLTIKLVSIWNLKARLWIKGRTSVFRLLEEKLPAKGNPVIWMHCASLGEFEQGRPLIEKLKLKYRDVFILLTFFSPSGFEVRKNYQGADLVTYLPMDGKKNAENFIEIVHPSLAIFVKYESWLHYLKSLKSNNIPTLLIAAIFKPQQNYFGMLGGFLRQMLEYYTHIFVQDKASLELMQLHEVSATCSISGDTRFDRVHEIAAEKFHHPVIESFCLNHEVIVAGSTWKEDEEILSSYLSRHPETRAILAPHEISPENISRLQSLFPNSVLVTNCDGLIPYSVNVIIINTIGMLSKIYRWSTVSYIGGGFNKAGIHNVLEAAVYGKVTVFGPHFNRSGEAETLIAKEAAFTFRDTNKFETLLTLLLNNFQLRKAGEEIAARFVVESLGATNTILGYISTLPNFKELTANK
jgi:3-deoxy-D-manno-octulosonic-acid transferase